MWFTSHNFYDPNALAIASAYVQKHRLLGYCPLHRHPDLVGYIEALTSLYGGELEKCLRVVDFERAEFAANPEPYLPDDYGTNRTVMDANYQRCIVEPAAALLAGNCRDCDDEDLEQPVFRFVECKGIK